MRSSGYGKWFNRKKENQDKLPQDVTCKNCHTHFDGNYCPVCGQGVNDLDRPFGFIFINFVGDMFAFDSRFFRTLKDLLFKPGYLTKQFFDGKRIRYATPTRLFILSSFILFFLLQVYSNQILNRVLDAPVKDEAGFETDPASVAYSDSLITDINSSLDSSIVVVPGVELTLDAFANKQNIREGLMELSGQMEKELAEEKDPEERVKLREQIRLIRNPEQAIAKILRYMSWAFFLLLPVFALILQLFYLRKNYFYTRHLVFSIHLHTFIFFIFILLVSLHLLFQYVNAYLSLGLIVTIPVYFVAALKRFYGQNILKVVLKFLGITIMYSLLFWLVVGGVFLRALSII